MENINLRASIGIVATWVCLFMTISEGRVIETSDDFTDTSLTFSRWVSIGTVATVISHDAISEEDYDDGDATVKLAYSNGMTLTGDGVKDDGGLILNSQNDSTGDEAIGLTIIGSMDTGEVITLSGSAYNDNSSYSRYNAQLWNVSDDRLLTQTSSTTVLGDISINYTPTSFNLTYTATTADDGDTLQIRFSEENNHTARDIYLDNFLLTTSSAPPPVYPHPRLFFNANEFTNIQARRLTTHADEWAQLLATCDRLVGTSPTTTPRTALGLLGYEDKIVALALAQTIDPSLPYQTTSNDWFWSIMNWPEWGSGNWSHPDYGPEGNLETGEILRALAVWYDLQYDTLTPSERLDASTRLADYGDRFRKSYSKFWTSNNGELTGNHCWNAFAALAAVQYASDDVSQARLTDWSNLLNSQYTRIRNLLTGPMSDGATGEGLTYWTYGIEKVLLWFEMRRVNGDTAFDGIDWFENTGTYVLFGIMPGGTDNFGGISRYDDADIDFWGNPYNEGALLAKATRDPAAQWIANEMDHSGARKKNAYRYMFYDPTVPTIDPDTEMNNWHFFDDYGLFFWRNSWADNAQHFTLRSGQHTHGHSKGDDGQFMLSRSGVPYIVDLGYAKPRNSRDANVLQIDNTGQYSDGDIWGGIFGPPWPQDSSRWGQTLHVLANNSDQQKGDFFNVLVNPTPMYTSSKLSSWNRETVGLGGDLYLMRDVVSTTSSAKLDLNLHGVATTASGDSYYENGTTNPWSESSTGKWDLAARSGAPKLHVQDFSSDAWNAVIEETYYSNKFSDRTRRGSNLKRSLSGTSGSSLISLGFDDLITDWTQTAWTDTAVEGVHVTASGRPIIDVLWPLNGISVSNSENWTVTGKMAGRRFGENFFGRDATLVQHRELVLLKATTPISFYAKTEQAPSTHQITVSADAESTVTIYCPTKPESVQIDNSVVRYSWTNNQLTLTIPATEASTIIFPTAPDVISVNPPPASTGVSYSLLAVNTIGDVSVPAQATTADSTITVHVSGADIWDQNDSFGFLNDTENGDIEIIARIESLGSTNLWAKSGVMIRESLNANAANILIAITDSGRVIFQERASAGAITSSQKTDIGTVTLPQWVRLKRHDDTFTGYYSSDGINWTKNGVATQTMSDTVYVGIAVTSSDDAVATQSDVTDFKVYSRTHPHTNRWYDTYFSMAELGDPNISSDSADPDNDALDNQLEYYLGRNPRAKDTTPAISMTQLVDNMRFTYDMANDASGVTGLLKWSEDLVTWSSTGLTYSSEPIPESSGHTRIHADLPQPASGRAFIKIEISE